MKPFPPIFAALLYLFLAIEMYDTAFAQFHNKINPPPTVSLVQDSVFADGVVVRLVAPMPTYLTAVEVFADSARTQKVLQISQFTASCRSQLMSIFPLTPGRTYFLQGRYHNTLLIEDMFGRPIDYTDTNRLTYASQPLRITLPQQSLPAMPLWDFVRDISSTSIRIRWQRYLGAAEQYVVEAARDTLFRDSVLRQTVSGTEAVFTGLQPSTQYFFRVQAQNQSGTSRFTRMSERTLLPNAPFNVDRVTGLELFQTGFNIEYTANPFITIPQADSLVALLARQGFRIQGAWFQNTVLDTRYLEVEGKYPALLAFQIQNPDSLRLSKIGFNKVTRFDTFVPFGTTIRSDNRWNRGDGECARVYSRLYKNIVTTSVQRETFLNSAHQLTLLSSNPFTSVTDIRYHLEQPSAIEFRIYSSHGYRIAAILRGIESAGEHTATWDGRTDDGQEAASGAYFILAFLNGKKVGEAKVMKMR